VAEDQASANQERIEELARSIDPSEFAAAIASADPAVLEENMRTEMREVILEGIFQRMPERLHRDRARDVDAVIEWRIGGRPDGGHDTYQVRIANGTCAVSRGADQGKPRVTFRLGGAEFLRLISGAASGPMLFLTGKLKIRGDLMFAAGVQSLFVLPGAAD
jgi:putative sterol carrier protein